MNFNRSQVRAIHAENRTWPVTLREIPPMEWPSGIGPQTSGAVLFHAWRSRSFLVMLFREPSGYQRLSIQRTEFIGAGKRARDGIDWDDIQRLKAEAGFGDFWAVECYPPTDQVVNVANMRHVFLMHEAPEFAWRKE